MLKRKIGKITFVLACLVTLLMPYTTNVFAALTKNDTTAELQVLILHEGGEESSNTLTDKQREFYDVTPYGYTLGERNTDGKLEDGKKVFKIIQKGDTGYSNMFYCLDATKAFPGVLNDKLNSLTYRNVADFEDSTDTNVKSLPLSGAASGSADWTANYKALVWLMNNMFLEKQTPEQKDAFLSKAFEDYDEWDYSTVKGFLTDDDIDVAQQYAIWHFTNGDLGRYATTEFPSVELLKIDTSTNEEITGSYNDLTGYPYRQSMIDHLYRYLIDAAANGGSSEPVTFPSIVDTKVSSSTEGNYYVGGPFKVTSGTAPAEQYTLKLVDQSGNEISRSDYKIKISGESEFTEKNINEIFDKEYSIYIPKTGSNITKVTLVLSYQSYETDSTLWLSTEKGPSDEDNYYQPVVLINRSKTPHELKKEVTFDKSEADLALRKYIIKVNNKTINRTPQVDASKLASGTEKTATYKHAKNPVKVAVGDTVLYEIRVYNEADIEAKETVVVDALPKGLVLKENSSINETYKWEKATNDGEYSTVYQSDYLKGQTIAPFDKNDANSLVNNSKYLQMECTVTSDAKPSSILTNIAEIGEDGIEDRDSKPGNNDYIQNDYDASNYKGDNSNPTDLSKSDYFYKGRQDDDDFEKIEVEGKAFDLNLRKFITSINKKAPATSREPKVDVTQLKNGTSTNATYTTVKNPLTIEKGDIVIYTIRVYNEGEVDGYVEELADYIPVGLGFLVGHQVNVDNYWAIPQNSKTVKLSTIGNGTKNLSKDDFNGVSNLNDVDVVVGTAKITSTKLKSSDTDTKNLISAFDKTNGKLSYKDIQVACVVLADKEENNNLKNIAEITKHSDKDKKPVTDVDSTPDTVDINNYPGNDKNQDDNDYENLTMKEPGKEPGKFDLSLQKFITAVNDGAVTGREPKVSKVSNGKFNITSNNNSAVMVQNNDLITYTIRVYNEGTMAGYAEEVSDDLPKGLVFVADNAINKKYNWKLYDANGKVTTDPNQAVSVKTDYLSKEKSEARKENCLLKPVTDNSTTLDYKDLQIVFRIDEPVARNNAGRKIINTAEITDDADENGNEVDDTDSTPGNNKDGEDDIDKEQVYVKFFDLSLKKDLVKIIITENNTTREISVTEADGLQKVEVHRKRIKSTVVKFVYNITVKNEGEIAGYATEISDNIPQGLEFIAEENKQWTKVSDSKVTTNALANTLLQPGQTASVQIVLKWINGENNLGLKTNVAEISADKNDSNTPDIDSTPNNQVPGEDDIDSADVMLQISTGTAKTYITLTTTVLMILSTGIILIKKFVL